jgi:hypothetical protein
MAMESLMVSGVEAGQPGSAHPLPAYLFSSRGKLPITLMDFSEVGATAKGAQQPDCDSFALLVRNGIKVPAIVQWIDGGRFGLSFEEPLIDEKRRDLFRGKRVRKSARPDAVDRTVLHAA